MIFPQKAESVARVRDKRAVSQQGCIMSNTETDKIPRRRVSRLLNFNPNVYLFLRISRSLVFTRFASSSLSGDRCSFLSFRSTCSKAFAY